MSASSPGSVMLRAATAASGGTGAPDWTYCSICACTVRTSAWTSRLVDGTSFSTSTRAERYGSERTKLDQAQPLLSLHDGPDGAVLELDDLGDLGQSADLVQLTRLGDVLLVGLPLRDQRDGRGIGHGPVEGLDGLVPSDLQRHDHLREDRRSPAERPAATPAGP